MRKLKTRSKTGAAMVFISKIKTSVWYGYIAAVLGVVISFILPIAPFLYLTIAIVLVDMVTGIRAAKKRGEKITSAGFSKTVEKFVLYTLAILLSEGIRNVLFEALPITYVVTTIIVLTEFKSILENIESVTGVPFLEALKKKFPKLFS